MCLVGCGGMGERHIRAYALLQDLGLSPFRLDADCDGDLDRAESAASTAERLLGRSPRVFGKLDEALRSDGIDAFDVATDPSSHHAVRMAILRAGRHLICEKPLALTPTECWDLIDAATDAGVVLATAENLRRYLEDSRGAGDHGKRRAGPDPAHRDGIPRGTDEIVISPWRHLKEKGSIALDLAVHHTDLISYLGGDFDRAFGGAFIAHEVRRKRGIPGAGPRVVPGSASGDAAVRRRDG